ncbi:MAG TPA: DsbA family protein [Oceanospirillaceae bacterium]|nr:DsbA family protein [Oceanospirillaceae bacterium]
MVTTTKTKLYYFHDPMCSWCWAFRPVWQRLMASLPDHISVEYVEGGLAADSDVAMSKAMQESIQTIWRQIERQVPGTEFNYEFWQLCQPRRSTYPACRALIAADKLGYYEQMLMAIQEAYYLHAQNPSNDETLVNLAVMEGMEEDNFRQFLHSPETDRQLQKNLSLCHEYGVQGFPSLILKRGNSSVQIPVDYRSEQPTLMAIKQLS